MKRTLEQMREEEAILQVEVSIAEEKLAKVREEIAAEPEEQELVSQRKDTRVRFQLPSYLSEQLIDKGRELFPKYGPLVDLIIEWKEAGERVEKDWYEDILTARIEFENGETLHGSYRTGDSRYSTPNVENRSYLHNESLEDDWQAALVHFSSNPAEALWALIVAAYWEYVNDHDGEGMSDLDDVLSVVWEEKEESTV